MYLGCIFPSQPCHPDQVRSNRWNSEKRAVRDTFALFNICTHTKTQGHAPLKKEFHPLRHISFVKKRKSTKAYWANTNGIKEDYTGVEERQHNGITGSDLCPFSVMCALTMDDGHSLLAAGRIDLCFLFCCWCPCLFLASNIPATLPLPPPPRFFFFLVSVRVRSST